MLGLVPKFIISVILKFDLVEILLSLIAELGISQFLPDGEKRKYDLVHQKAQNKTIQQLKKIYSDNKILFTDNFSKKKFISQLKQRIKNQPPKDINELFELYKVTFLEFIDIDSQDECSELLTKAFQIYLEEIKFALGADASILNELLEKKLDDNQEILIEQLSNIPDKIVLPITSILVDMEKKLEQIQYSTDVIVQNSVSHVHFEPKEIPNDIDSFVGRQKEIDQLGEIYQNQSTIGIFGLGSVGKTTLATKFANQIKDNFEGDIYINCQGGGNVSLSNNAEYLIAPFKAREIAQKILASCQLPKYLLENSNPFNALRSYLKQKDFLIFLDNVGTVEQIAPIINGEGTFIITSREFLSIYNDDNSIRLYDFEYNDFEQFLSENIDAELSEEDIHKIEKITYRNPLLLEIISSQIRNNRTLTTQDYLSSKTVSKTIEQAVDNLFSDIFDNLSEIQKDILLFLATYEDSIDIGTFLDLYQLPDVLIDEEESILIEENFDYLINISLITEVYYPEVIEYSLHDILREFIINKSTLEQKLRIISLIETKMFNSIELSLANLITRTEKSSIERLARLMTPPLLTPVFAETYLNSISQFSNSITNFMQSELERASVFSKINNDRFAGIFNSISDAFNSMDFMIEEAQKRMLPRLTLGELDNWLTYSDENKESNGHYELEIDSEEENNED